MEHEAYFHQPVLLKEVIDFLSPEPGENFVDATLGGGGYSWQILDRVESSGNVLSIDCDLDAIKFAENQKSKIKNQNWILVHGNFRDIDKIVKHHRFGNISGIVADLGLSSYELDQSGRGFSFQKKEILDMRFDLSQKTDARFILESSGIKELTKIFREFGEEKFAAQIARGIQRVKDKGLRIKDTQDLYQIIELALPKPVRYKAKDSARRIFQALRIAVNHELENLQEFLPKAFNLLNANGRLAVVSFHSLEDRIVKQYFSKLTKGCVCPPDFPQCLCGRSPQGKLLTKRPVVASEEEIKLNSRAKAAKLRAIVKL
jgi:16S rRNA (cytosine1402-N4)-methyltransferase